MTGGTCVRDRGAFVCVTGSNSNPCTCQEVTATHAWRWAAWRANAQNRSKRPRCPKSQAPDEIVKSGWQLVDWQAVCGCLAGYKCMRIYIPSSAPYLNCHSLCNEYANGENHRGANWCIITAGHHLYCLLKQMGMMSRKVSCFPYTA
eukprot:1160897-Pelagomonas_calceolata.AAC.10